MGYSYDRRAIVAAKKPKTKQEWEKAYEDAEEKHRKGKMTNSEWQDFNRAYKEGIKKTAGSGQLDSARRSKINRDLIKHGFDGNGRFRSMGAAMNGMNAVLEASGLELDDVPSAHYFMRDQGTVNFRLAFSNPEDAFSPVPIKNTTLHISYTKLSEDRYEVVSYLS